MKSPIKWMGGKNRSVDLILSIMPKHYTYVEPFFGAGWIFFAKDKANVEILNDINGDLINFFEIIRTQYEQFEERICYTLKSKDLFMEYRQTMSDKNLSPLERAFRFYYVNQNAFGGLVRYNSKGICNSPYMRHPKRKPGGSYWELDKIINAHKRLKDVSIENDDFKIIITKYDTEDTLFFLDPPYECKSGKYNGEPTFDYDELLTQCRNIKGKFILTLNSGLEDKFKEFYIMPNDVHYSIGCTTNSSKTYKEIIVTNYDIHTIL